MYRAASFQLRQLAENLDFIRETDYADRLTDLRNLEFNLKHDRRLRTMDTVKKLRYLGWQVGNYVDAYDLINESFLSLIALGLVASEKCYEEITDFLREESWATKHEILTRWGWIKKHLEMLRDGKEIEDPFYCLVARRGNLERKYDKEFYALLSFLHCLRAVEGRELLFFSNQDTPDFTLRDASGNQIGIEITEVSISDEWDEEQDTQRLFEKSITASLKNSYVFPHVEHHVSWTSIKDRLSEFDAWFSAKTAGIATITDEIELQDEELGLRITLRPSEHSFGWISFSNPYPRGDADIQDASEAMHATLRQRIENKIVKRGKPRLKPSIDPCYLVVYPNHDFDADLERVITEFFRHPPIDVGSHFSEVWLSNERRLDRLV